MIPPGYKPMHLRDVQLMQLKAMKVIHTKCIENNITYYLIAGSLLGAVRHAGFIPWDDDIDIAMMRKDYEKFKLLFPQIFDLNKYFLQHYDTDQDFQPALMRLCIRNTFVDIKSLSHQKHCKNTYIDIFPLDNIPDDTHNRTIQARYLNNLDRLIRLKLYSLYPENGYFKRGLKKIVASVIPLKYLQHRRETVMKQYLNDDTKCVSSTVSKYGYFKQIMPRCIYGTPRLIKFEDTEFFCPEYYNEYLTTLYGKDYMKLPPIEKRIKPKNVYRLI